MAENIRRRNTRQRQVVLEELKKLTSHPTATELYELARRRLPKISLGTVYRNLELLARMGVIRKLQAGGSEARFDGDAARHHHVRCVRCGRLNDLHDLPAGVVSGTRLKGVDGYEILDCRLEFIGVCPACRGASTPDRDETQGRAAD